MNHQHLKTTLVAALAVALAGGLPVASQAMGDKSTTSSTKSAGSTQAQSTLSSSDKKFIEAVGKGGLAEVEFGQLAQQKAQSPDVKQFGQKMVTDHSTINDKLKQMASQKSVNLPTALEGSEKREYDKLQKLSGTKFDQEYMKTMVSDHEKELKAFKKEAKSTKDADVKSFADSTASTIEQHLQLAKSTEASPRRRNPDADFGADAQCEGDSLCQTGKHSNGLRKIGARARLPRRRPENSFARKWSTSARASTVHGRPSRRSPSVCPRRDAPASICCRPRKARFRRRRGAVPSALTLLEKRAPSAYRAGDRVPSRARCGAKSTARHRVRPWPDRRRRLRGAAARRRDRARHAAPPRPREPRAVLRQRKKQHARAQENVDA